MITLIELLVLFGVFYVLAKFITGGVLSTVFIGRLSLLFLLLLSGGFYINIAINMDETATGVTNMSRTSFYFFGLFQVALSIGMVFRKSLLAASIILITVIVILAALNIFDFVLDLSINRAKFSSATGLIDYAVLVIWTYLFGIHLKSGTGVFGAIRNASEKAE